MPFSKDSPNSFLVAARVSFIDFAHEAMALLLLFSIQGQIGMEKLGCLAVKSSQALGPVRLRARRRVVWRRHFRAFFTNGPSRLPGLEPCLLRLIASILPVGMLASRGFGDFGLQVIENRVATADSLQVNLLEVDQIRP